MKVFGFELSSRAAYDTEILRAPNSETSGSIFLAVIIYHSIKRNWVWFSHLWRRYIYSPKKIMKKLSRVQMFEAVRQIYVLEGAKSEDLVPIDYELGNKTIEELAEWKNRNKKKEESILLISKQ